MIKINDIRDDDAKQLKDIELGGFFYYDDVLYRRIFTEVDFRCNELDVNALFAMVIATGELVTIDRLTWVEPIADKQVFLEISD